MNDNYETKIHKSGAIPWDASDATLNYLMNFLHPGMYSCETGAGKTSIIFAKSGSNHWAITPSDSEVENIKSISKSNNIDLSKTHFIIGFSQDIVPNLEFPEKLDILLIDGGHGFPIPQIDFSYLARHLKIGGKLLIDDIDIWTGKILVDFLKSEPSWKFETCLRNRTAVFIKTEEFKLREWCHQDFIVRKSRLTRIFRKIKNASSLLLKGRFSDFYKNLKREIATPPSD